MSSRRRQLSRIALIAVLVIGLLVAGPAGAVGSTFADEPGGSTLETAGAQPSAPEIQTETTPEADTTTTRIAIQDDGSAEWQLTIRMELETDTDVEEFSAFEEEFERNRSQYVGGFRDQMTGVVENAATATGREMNATAFEGETGVQEAPRRWGYVTYRFTWEGFAQAEDGTVTLGDVFQGGYFLGEDDILIIESPTGYETSSTDPNPDRQRTSELQWNGPASFASERPEVTLTDGSETTGDGSPETPASGSAPVLLAVVGILIVLVVAGLAYGRYWRPTTGGTTDPDESDSGATVATSNPPEATDAAGVAELATDEDQVLSLLESEGGRIRQADIADRLDWSDSKTSRVLSEMADEGMIEKLRIGRENVIDLAEEQD